MAHEDGYLLIRFKNSERVLISLRKAPVITEVVITEFCFSKGLAADPQEWAEYVWYKNLVDGKNDDYILDIVELCSACQRAAQSIKPGTRGGGTTILLPFGFVQWHQGQMQFHHSLKAINQLKDLPRN